MPALRHLTAAEAGTAFGDGSLRGTMRGRDPIPETSTGPLGIPTGALGGSLPLTTPAAREKFPLLLPIRLFAADPELRRVPHNYLDASRCAPFCPY